VRLPLLLEKGRGTGRASPPGKEKSNELVGASCSRVEGKKKNGYERTSPSLQGREGGVLIHFAKRGRRADANSL